VAKLDRLARNLNFIAALMDAGLNSSPVSTACMQGMLTPVGFMPRPWASAAYAAIGRDGWAPPKPRD
jgi:hypothetical protein